MTDARLDAARDFCKAAEALAAEARLYYGECWQAYEAAKQETCANVKASVESYSHLLEGRLVVKRVASFCDMSGEEIPTGTGATVRVTQGEEVFEADLSDKSVKELLALLNNPEAKKKRGRKAEKAAA